MIIPKRRICDACGEVLYNDSRYYTLRGNRYGQCISKTGNLDIDICLRCFNLMKKYIKANSGDKNE